MIALWFKHFGLWNSYRHLLLKLQKLSLLSITHLFFLLIRIDHELWVPVVCHLHRWYWVLNGRILWEWRTKKSVWRGVVRWSQVLNFSLTESLMMVKGVGGFNDKALSVSPSSCFFSFNFEHLRTLVVLLIIASIVLLFFLFSLFLDRRLSRSLIRRPVSLFLKMMHNRLLHSLGLLSSELVLLLLPCLCLRIDTPHSLVLNDGSNKSVLSWSYISSASHRRGSPHLAL